MLYRSNLGVEMTIGKCKKCNEVKKLTRGFCASHCYPYLMRNNLIKKIRQHMADEDWILYALPEHL